MAELLAFIAGLLRRAALAERTRRPKAAPRMPPPPYVFDSHVFAAERRTITNRRSTMNLDPPSPAYPQQTLGLALSGGGIRSATFSLGVLQSLAKRNLLPAFDYVSTVSGGGYAGCFLGGFFLPEALRQDPKASPDPAAFEAQARRAYQAFKDSADPLAAPADTAGVRSMLVRGGDDDNAPTDWSAEKAFEWLRNNGRYLAPRGAGDLIYVIAMQIRNWAAVQYVVALVIVTGLVAFATTRAWLIAESSLWRQVEVLFLPEQGAAIYWSPGWALVGVFALLTIVPPALAYWVAHARVDRKEELSWIPLWHEGMIIFFLLLGLSWACIVLVVERSPDELTHPSAGLPIVFWLVVGYVLLSLSAIGTFLAGLLIERKGAAAFKAVCYAGLCVALLGWWSWGHAVGRIGLPVGAVVIGFLAMAYVARMETTKLDLKSLRTRFTRWLRWTFQLSLAGAGLALLGTIGQTLYAYLLQRPAGAGTFAGVTSAVALLVGGARQLFKWMGAGTKQAHPMIPLTALAGAAAVLLLLLTGSVWAVGVQAALWEGGPPPAVPDSVRAEQPRTWKHATSVHVSAWGRGADSIPLPRSALGSGTPAVELEGVAIATGWMSVLLAGVAFLFVTTGLFLNFLNMSSLHQFYAARLTRAYLGATNRARFKAGGVVAVTTPLPTDTIPLAAYYHPDLAGPVHLINVTLNQTRPSEGQLVQRDRKGTSMVVGPQYTVVNSAVFRRMPNGTLMPLNDGAFTLARHKPKGWGSFVRWVVLGKEATQDQPTAPVTYEEASRWRPIRSEVLDIGDWCAISGAAFSTGMGMRTSLGLSLLAGLANVRLGYWWNFNSDRLRSGFFAAYRYLWSELLGDFRGPWRPFWFLTDGGHFDNTGVYELVRRRVGIILLCDNGCDPDFRFDDLGNLARKIRTDFSAEMRPIEPSGKRARYFATVQEFGKRKLREDKCALLYEIRYPGVDHGTPSSDRTLLIVLKPNKLSHAPVDVIDYASVNEEFPHQSTLDQFFDEAQWESYRKMGEVTAEAAVGEAALSFDGWHKRLLHTRA
jgi:hypothetical protein